MTDFKTLKEYLIMITNTNKNHDDERNAKNKSFYIAVKLYSTDIGNYKEKKNKG